MWCHEIYQNNKNQKKQNKLLLLLYLIKIISVVQQLTRYAVQHDIAYLKNVLIMINVIEIFVYKACIMKQSREGERKIGKHHFFCIFWLNGILILCTYVTNKDMLNLGFVETRKSVKLSTFHLIGMTYATYLYYR